MPQPPGTRLPWGNTHQLLHPTLPSIGPQHSAPSRPRTLIVSGTISGHPVPWPTTGAPASAAQTRNQPHRRRRRVGSLQVSFYQPAVPPRHSLQSPSSPGERTNCIPHFRAPTHSTTIHASNSDLLRDDQGDPVPQHQPAGPPCRPLARSEAHPSRQRRTRRRRRLWPRLPQPWMPAPPGGPQVQRPGMWSGTLQRPGGRRAGRGCPPLPEVGGRRRLDKLGFRNGSRTLLLSIEVQPCGQRACGSETPDTAKMCRTDGHARLGVHPRGRGRAENWSVNDGCSTQLG